MGRTKPNRKTEPENSSAVTERNVFPKRNLRPELFFFLFILLCFALQANGSEETGDLREYRAAMEKLADTCESSGMKLEAKVTRSRTWEEPEYGFFVPRLPDRPMESLPDDAKPEQKEWFLKLRSIEKEYGGRFRDRAKKLAEAGRGKEAYRAAETALFIDPDHQETRLLFGYELYDGTWRRKWEIVKLEEGKTSDPQYGWISEKEREKTEGTSKKGSRKKRGKITVETEHFEIKTTCPREEAASLGRRLEDFHRFWTLLFYPEAMTEKEAATAVLEKTPVHDGVHKVVLFQNREEYLHEILTIDPGAEISSGGYFPDKKTIYLYLPDPSDEEETPIEVMAVHEAVHQLFAETRFVRGSAQRRRLDPGADSQFWITEGIATYLETFEQTAGGWTAGGLRSYRFVRAKERVHEPNGLVPLAELAVLGKKEFQNNPEPAKLYTESAGLTSFFFHGESGKYREAFLAALYKLYQGEDDPEMLEQLTGVSYGRLDREFRSYLETAPFKE